MCSLMDAGPSFKVAAGKLYPWIRKERPCVVCAWVRPLLWQLQEVQDEPGLFQVSSQWIYAVVVRFEAVFCYGGFGCI